MHGLGQLPAGEVRQSVVADLACSNETVQGAEGFVKRRPRVVGVHLIEVHRVNTEPGQRCVEGAGEMPGGEPVAVRGRGHREPALGGQHHALGEVLRSVGEPGPDDLLGNSGRVDVGGVHQRATRLEEPVQLGKRALLVGFRAEGHGAQAEMRDGTAAAS
jgi:hypothetical protein